MNTQGKKPLLRSKRLWAISALSICLSVLALLRSASTSASAVEVVSDDVQTSVISASEDVLIATAVSMRSGGDSSAIPLTEGQSVVIHYLDASISATAKDETVAQLLSRMKIEPGPLDMVAVDQSTDPLELSLIHI